MSLNFLIDLKYAAYSNTHAAVFLCLLLATPAEAGFDETAYRLGDYADQISHC